MFRNPIFPNGLPRSPLRKAWYKDGSYLFVSVIGVVTCGLCTYILYLKATGKIKPEDIIPDENFIKKVQEKRELRMKELESKKEADASTLRKEIYQTYLDRKK